MELENALLVTSKDSILDRLVVMFCFNFVHVSHEVRAKLDVRSMAAIHCGDACYDGFKGNWYLLIENGVFIVSDNASQRGCVPTTRPTRLQAFGLRLGEQASAESGLEGLEPPYG